MVEQTQHVVLKDIQATHIRYIDIDGALLRHTIECPSCSVLDPSLLRLHRKDI